MSNVRYESSGDATRLIIEGRVDIRSAGDLQKMFCDAVTSDLPIVVDCTAAEWLDTACMQLLLATHRAATGRVTIRVTSESQLRHWFESSGFAAHLTMAS